MDPIGQSYLPGYFCPAALFDSRETTQDKGRVGQRQHRDYCSSDQTEMNRNKKGHRSLDYWYKETDTNLLQKPAALLADKALNSNIAPDYLMDC